MRIEILTFCDQLVAAVANGIYQGIIVAALVWLSLRALGRTNAATRHAVWFCTLLLLVSLMFAHCLLGSLPFANRPAKSNDIVTAPDANSRRTTAGQGSAAKAGIDSTASPALHLYLPPRPEETLAPKPGSQAFATIELVASEVQSNPSGDLFPQPIIANGEPLGNVASVGEPLASANVPRETTKLRWLAERLVNPISLKLPLGSAVPRRASMILLALWLTIGCVRVFVLLLQLSRIRKLKHSSFPPGAALNELFQRLTSRAAVNREVHLKVSPTHRSSFLLGFLHPVILLPSAERMEPGEAELVLRHELAHVRRRDDWANLVQQFILAVFFFHPAIWWISKQLSVEREIACDDHVLQQSRKPQAYALLLANLAARLQQGLPLLAPGSSNNKTQLKQRIDMILNTRRNTSPRLAKTWLAIITSAAALLAVAIICSAPRIVLAQNETAPAPASAPSADAVVAAPAPGLVSVAITLDAPDSDSAEAVSRTPAPATVSPGPKSKPGSTSVLKVRPVVATVPAAPAAPAPAPVKAVVPNPPTPFLAAVEPMPEPGAPHSPRPAGAPRPGNKDRSLEDRLERLERMVESLMKQQNFHLRSANDGMIDRTDIANISAQAKRQAEFSRRYGLDPKEIEKIKERAEREAGHATEQAKRATADAEKSLKAEQKLHTARKFKEGSQKQLEALRKQLEMLEREKEKLDRQIEVLEQNQEQLDERDEDQEDGDKQPPPPAR